MKRILIITQIYPSGLTGTSVKTRNTIDYLLNQDYHIDVCCVHHDIMIRTPYEHPNLRIFFTPGDIISRFSFSHFMKALRVLFSPIPYRVLKMHSSRLNAMIHVLRHSHAYDFVFFDGFSTLQYASEYDSHHMYIDDEDITDLMWRRYLTEKNPLLKLFDLIEFWKCGWYEKEYLRRMKQVWAISERTKKRLSQVTKTKVTLMPTVIEVPKRAFMSSAKDIVFTGLLNWTENINGIKWFIENAWEPILKTYPRTKLHIVGQLAGDDLKQYLSTVKNVILHGYVPDLLDVYTKAAVAIAPIWINCGIKIKTLTYLSYGLPVVSSKEAIWGMASANGVVESTQDKFFTEIILLLGDQKKRKKLSDAGIKNIRQNHSYQTLQQFFKKVKV